MGNSSGSEEKSTASKEASQKQHKNLSAQTPKPEPRYCRDEIKTLVEKRYPSSKMSNLNIEEDSKDAKDAVLSARNGEWTKVFEVLGRPGKPNKDYLINCIPETRRWGILHQAVYWQKNEILRNLLAFEGCDVQMKAKVGDSEIGNAVGKNAIQIADDFKYEDLATLLKKTIPLQEGHIETFVPYDADYEAYAHPLLRITLALYRDSFYSSRPIQSNESLHSILFNIFVELEDSTDLWKKFSKVICDSLTPVSQSSVNFLENVSNKLDFYRTIIKVYTVENDWLYAYINLALRRQTVKHYVPQADDLACGPYILMYYMLMLFWVDLKPEFGTTYRRLTLTEDALAKYKPHTKFIWAAFTSSALEEERACPFPTCPSANEGLPGHENIDVVFVIDNSLKTPWNPRNIESYAEFNETERTYIPGARFQVVQKEEIEYKKLVRIVLKLVH